jgi:two-component system, NtrC family, nitrogen regulation sensor histidine kinase GlnL
MTIDPQKSSLDTALLPAIVLNTIRHPVIMLAIDNRIAFANSEAEGYFKTSLNVMARHKLSDYVPFGSPLLALVEQVRERKSPVNEYRVDISSPRLGNDRLVDIYVAPVSEELGSVVVLLQERLMADKLDRQMTHRGAARSVTGLASMLAHEIKNPLSGIRGAAQLLETVVSDEDRDLTRLITDETDRIVSLVDRMEVFSDARPIERQPVNIHIVLDHVRAIARNGFGRHIKFSEGYDPSLPPVFANRDQLVQIFLNLVKNAAEAIGDDPNGEITLSTAFRPGVRLSVPGSRERVSLPLEFCVHDNGKGVPEELRTYLFDPFVTTKTNGTGLGLALVAKIVGDHGGVVECESQPRRTTFRILLPAYSGPIGSDGDDYLEIAEGARLESKRS